MKINMKRIVSIFLVLLFVSVQITGVFANESAYTTLKFRSRGSAVVKLQQALIDQGYLKDEADGIYGVKTEKSVISFQIAKKIRVDGIAGKQTQSILFAQPVSLSRGTVTRELNSTDLYWMSRIIHAEAEAEPYNGKVAVGNVIMNRVKSSDFPNTVKGVIFEYYKGIPQFSPVEEGTIYNNPSNDSAQAAKDALNGVSPVGEASYFFNPDKAAGKWIVQNKSFLTKIGNHSFYN